MSHALAEFGLLLASVREGLDDPVLVHRVAASDSSGANLLFAADRAGARHILAPIADKYAFTPHRGASIDLSEWRNPETRQRYLDLSSSVDGLAVVFYHLADSIVERIEQRGEQCHAAVLGALDDWQRLLKAAASMGEEAIRGLFGELYMLKMLAERNPVFAVDCWAGPGGGVHDFVSANGDLEVKTTKRDGRDVEISSISQLDEVAGVPLCLVRVQVENSANGRRIGDLLDELVDLGCLRTLLVDKLSLLGFLPGVTSDEKRFIVSEPPLVWSVGPDFPGLRSDDLPVTRRAAVTRMKYTLDLLDAPGQLSEPEFLTYADRMMSK